MKKMQKNGEQKNLLNQNLNDQVLTKCMYHLSFNVTL